MNAILNWMFSAHENSATIVSDQIASDMICNLGAKDFCISGSENLFFFINHLSKEFILIPGLSNFTLICSREN